MWRFHYTSGVIDQVRQVHIVHDSQAHLPLKCSVIKCLSHIWWTSSCSDAYQ